MRCSVIIPTRNRAQILNDYALTSLEAMNFAVDQFEVLVVDNGSTDGTDQVTNEFIEQHPQFPLQYINEPEPGMLSGRHKGVLEAKGEILVFIDDDVIVDKNWLTAIVDTFDDLEVQLVGGKNLPKYESPPPEWLKWFWRDHPDGTSCGELSLLDLGDEEQIISANFVWGLNFSIRKNALFELGGFHPDCIPAELQHLQGDGETGLTIKANVLGYKTVYQPKALLYHVVPKDRLTFEYFDKRYFYQGICESFADLRRKHIDPPSQYFLFKKRTHKFMLKLKAMMDSTKGEYDSEGNAKRNNNIPKEIKELKLRFKNKYEEGYDFHQLAFRENPAVREWVLKKDYWDYKLPNPPLEKV